MPYAKQLGGLQINYIEMFIKLAFVILLSVEIEACNVRVRKIPANLSKRERDRIGARSFIPDGFLQQTWPRVNLNTYTFIDSPNVFSKFFQLISQCQRKILCRFFKEFLDVFFFRIISYIGIFILF